MKYIAPVEITTGKIMLLAEVERLINNKIKVVQIIWVSNLAWLYNVWEKNPKVVIDDLEDDYFIDKDIFNEYQIIIKTFGEFIL